MVAASARAAARAASSRARTALRGIEGNVCSTDPGFCPVTLDVEIAEVGMIRRVRFSVVGSLLSCSKIKQNNKLL